MVNTRTYILLIIFVILSIYSNSFQNEFAWDDEFLIMENPSIMSWKYAWTHFALDLYHSFSNYYRPVQMISYMIDFSLWRLDPFGYHLTNVFLHICVSLSLFMLIQFMAGDRRVAFIGALFYAVHPAHTAAVTYIAGRADSLAALFLVLSLILFHLHFKAQKNRKALFLYIGSLFSFLLALLSKEIAVVFPIMILFYGLFFINGEEAEKSRGIIKFHYMSWFVIMAAVYIILRIYALNFQEAPLFLSSHPFHIRLITSLKAVGIYFGIIFLPLHLHMERDIPYVLSFFKIDVILPLFLLLFILWLVVRVRRISKQASFGFLFFIIALLPVLNIYPLYNNMAEHWLYIPMLGMSMFLSSLGIKVWDAGKAFRPILLLIMLAYVIFFSYRTFDRNFDWLDEHTIYTHTYSYNPKSTKVLNNLGNWYHEKDILNLAMIFHKEALRVNPGEYKTHYNLGLDYEKMGLPDKALRQYKKSILWRPDYAKAHFNMGNIYTELGKIDLAAQAHKQAVQYDEFHTGAHTNLGNIYFDAGNYQKAREFYEKTIGINPYLSWAHNNLGNALSKLGLHREAMEEYKEAIELDPDNFEYHLSLGTAYGKSGMHAEAIKELKQAYKLKPRNAETLINLGAAYFHKGDTELAKKEWRKALMVDPQNVLAEEYLNSISP